MHGSLAQPLSGVELDPSRPLVVDAVRTLDQVSALAGGANLIHVHLTADDAVLEARYELRRLAEPKSELGEYALVRSNVTERDIETLAPIADLVLDTGQLGMEGDPRCGRRASGQGVMVGPADRLRGQASACTAH